MAKNDEFVRNDWVKENFSDYRVLPPPYSLYERMFELFPESSSFSTFLFAVGGETKDEKKIVRGNFRIRRSTFHLISIN